MDETEKTLLIAEDSADEVFIMRRAFSKTRLPMQLRFVPNGQEAIDYLERKPPYNNSETFPVPDAVILDINMPLVTGLEVLAWLKLHPTLNRLPAIIHTSSTHDADRAEAARLGARAYHVKGSIEALVSLFQTIASDLTVSQPPSEAANAICLGLQASTTPTSST